MIDVVIRSKYHVQYSREPRELIRDFMAPIGSVSRIHRKLFTRPQRKQINVEEVAAKPAAQPLSAYMIDPKYLPREVPIDPKYAPQKERIKPRVVSSILPRRPHPPVVQYSRLNRLVPAEVPVSPLKMGWSFISLLTPVSFYFDEVADGLGSYYERLKDMLAMAAENTAVWYHQNFVYPAPIHYSLPSNDAQPFEMDEETTKRTAPVLALLLISIIAVYGLLTHEAINTPGTDTGGVNVTTPTQGSSGDSGFTLGASESNDGDKPSDSETKEDNQTNEHSMEVADSATGSAPASDSQDDSPTAPFEGARGGGYMGTEPIEPYAPASNDDQSEGDSGTDSAPSEPEQPPATQDPSIDTPLDPVLDPVADPLVEEINTFDAQLLDEEVVVLETEVKVQDTQILSNPEKSIGL